MVSAMGSSGDQQNGVAIGVRKVEELDAHSRHPLVAGLARDTDDPAARLHLLAVGELKGQAQLLPHLEQQVGADEGSARRQVLRVELDVRIHRVGGVGDRDRQLDCAPNMSSEVASPRRRGHGVTWSGATSRSSRMSSPRPAPGARNQPRDTRLALTLAAAWAGSESKASCGTANSPSSRTRQRTLRAPTREDHFTSRRSGSEPSPFQRTSRSPAMPPARCSGSSASCGKARGATAAAMNGPTSSPPSPVTWYGWPSASVTGLSESPAALNS